MTSPIGSKPSQTVKDYETVHSQGSSFGQDLDEAKVRKLLSNRVSSPFSKAATNIVQTINEVVNNIADSIRGGGGAKYSVIDDAVNDRLGPIDSAITESGKQFEKLSDKVTEYDKAQKEVLSEIDKTLEASRNAVSAAEQARTDLSEFTARVSEQVDTLTVTADNALAKADSLSEKQREILSEAEENRKVLDQAVLDLDGVTQDLEDYKAELNRISEQASQGVADAKAANDAIQQANKELSSRIADGVAAHDDVKKAVADSKKAAEALDNLVDVGASLVPYEPGTRTPAWAAASGVEPTEEFFEGSVVYKGPTSATTYTRPAERYSKVAPNTIYKVTLWARADEPGSFLFVGAVDAESRQYAVESSTQGREDTDFVSSNYPVSLLTLNTEWTKHEWYIKFYPEVREIFISSFIWNHRRGVTTQQYVARFDMTPATTPPQALSALNDTISSTSSRVEEAVESAARAHARIEEQVEEVGEVRKLVVQAQEALDETNAQLGERIDQAVSSNEDVQDALKEAQRASTQLEEYSSTLDEALSEIDSLQNDAIKRNEILAGTNSSAIDVLTSAMQVQQTVNENQERWNEGASAALKAQDVLNQHQEEWNRGVQTALEAQNVLNENQDKWNQTASDLLELQSEAIKRNEVVGSTNATAIEVLNESWKAQEVVNQKQEEWNQGATAALEAQNVLNEKYEEWNAAAINSIQALNDQQRLDEEFQEEQLNWNRASTDAAKALSRATKLLAKPEHGNSLIAYEQPRAEDLEDPEKTVDWKVPEWWRAFDGQSGSYTVPEGFPSDNKRFYGEKSYIPGQDAFRPVKPDTEYRLSFWAFGEDEITMSVRTNLGTTGIASSKEVIERIDKIDYRDVNHDGRFPVRGAALFSSPKQFTYIIKFDPKVTEAKLDAFWFVDSGRTTSAEQIIGGLAFEPNVPTQSEVDKAQDKALESLNLSADLSKAFQEKQKSINRTVQMQQWLHQDMLELLDIRTPKSYGWPAGYRQTSDGGKTTNPYSGNKAYRIATPYYEQWEENKTVYVAARGRWVGWMQVMINWDSGVVDEWYVEVTDDERIFRFNGGAIHIKMRFIGCTVFPRSLRRIAGTSFKRGGYFSGVQFPHRWDAALDKNGLVRKRSDAYILFKNTVTCTHMVVVRDEDDNKINISAGKPIFSTVIYANDQIAQDGTVFVFEEVDDPSISETGKTSYVLDSSRPSGSAKVYDSHVRD